MGNFLSTMCSITTPIVPGEELQILTGENGRQTMARLWLKLIFALALAFGSLFLLPSVPGPWLVALLMFIVIYFSLAPMFISGDMFMLYYLPGIRLLDEGLLVKNRKSLSHKFYPYSDVTQIQQLTTGHRKMKHQVKLIFLDGGVWFTNKRPDTSIPVLIQLTNVVKEKCNCSVWPVFDAELASTLPGQD